MLAAQSRERSGCWTKNATGAVSVGFIERFPDFGSSRLRACEIFAVNKKRCERDERWIVETLAVANLFLIKARVVLGAGVAERVVIRMIGLNQHTPGKTPATSSASDLCN